MMFPTAAASSQSMPPSLTLLSETSTTYLDSLIQQLKHDITFPSVVTSQQQLNASKVQLKEALLQRAARTRALHAPGRT